MKFYVFLSNLVLLLVQQGKGRHREISMEMMRAVILDSRDQILVVVRDRLCFYLAEPWNDYLFLGDFRFGSDA